MDLIDEIAEAYDDVEEIYNAISNTYDNAFKDGVNFCIKILQYYDDSEDNVNSFYGEAIQHIKEEYSIMMEKFKNKKG